MKYNQLSVFRFAESERTLHIDQRSQDSVVYVLVGMGLAGM
jgi:hypothetical protein